MHIQLTFTLYQGIVLYTDIVCCPVPFIFRVPRIVVIEIRALFSLTNTFFYRRFPFKFFLFSFSFSLEIFIFLLFPIRFRPNFASLHSILKSIVGKDLSKSAEDHGLKIETDVVLYEEQDGRSKVVGLAAIFGVGVTNPA